MKILLTILMSLLYYSWSGHKPIRTYIEPEGDHSNLGVKIDRRLLADTVKQKLIFACNHSDFTFSVVYLVSKPVDFRYWRIRMIDLRQLSGPLFTKRMLGHLSNNFEDFYHIPIEIPLSDFNSIITDGDIGYFLKLKDYNMDGVIDVGISIDASGNNVDESIFINLSNSYFYWKGLSGQPIWEENKAERTITTGWHMGADTYGKYVYKILSDTTLIELLREDSKELNDSTIIRTYYNSGVVTKRDTINRRR
ncbi:MAG: hypothetical protein RIA63_00170 [Cyclobacteriaceae bacterium]